jgi:hypothetical protein
MICLLKSEAPPRPSFAGITERVLLRLYTNSAHLSPQEPRPATVQPVTAEPGAAAPLAPATVLSAGCRRTGLHVYGVLLAPPRSRLPLPADEHFRRRQARATAGAL